MNQNITNTPDPLAAERAELDAAILANAASAALNQVGCLYVDLFAPQVEQELRRTPEGEIVALDDENAPRRGVTAAILARELRDTWEKKDRGRWFR